MNKTIEELKATARHALRVGIFSTGFHALLKARKLIVASLRDLEDIADPEAEKLILQLTNLLQQVNTAIDEALGIVCDDPDSEAEVSHRPGTRMRLVPALSR